MEGGGKSFNVNDRDHSLNRKHALQELDEGDELDSQASQIDVVIGMLLSDIMEKPLHS